MGTPKIKNANNKIHKVKTPKLNIPDIKTPYIKAPTGGLSSFSHFFKRLIPEGPSKVATVRPRKI